MSAKRPGLLALGAAPHRVRARRARAVLALVLPFFTGCAASIAVRNPGPYPSSGRSPVFESAAVTGLVFEQARVTSAYVGSSSAVAVAVAGPNSALAWAENGSVAATYDYQKTYEAQDYLRMLLEDTRLVRRVTSKSDVEIRGVFLSLEKTTGALDFWNYGSQLLLFAFLGTPLFGSREAAVNLRVYQDGELLGTFIGRGDCFGRGNVYNAIAGIRQLEACALGNAIANAVRKLQEAHLDGRESHALPPRAGACRTDARRRG